MTNFLHGWTCEHCLSFFEAYGISTLCLKAETHLRMAHGICKVLTHEDIVDSSYYKPPSMTKPEREANSKALQQYREPFGTNRNSDVYEDRFMTHAGRRVLHELAVRWR